MDQDSRGRATARDPASLEGRSAVSERVFEVRIAGLVPQRVLSELEDVEISSQELRTVLSGRFRDQAELHGFLARLRALGLDVVEVRRVAMGTVEDDRTAGDL